MGNANAYILPNNFELYLIIQCVYNRLGNKTMTTATLKCVVKSMVSEIENLRRSEIVSKLIDGVEFITLLTLPILLPIGIMYLATAGY